MENLVRNSKADRNLRRVQSLLEVPKEEEKGKKETEGGGFRRETEFAETFTQLPQEGRYV